MVTIPPLRTSYPSSRFVRHRSSMRASPRVRRHRYSRFRNVTQASPAAFVETPRVPAWKHGLDLLLVLLILPWAIVLLPVIFCWIKLASPGPFIFRQTRMGRGGKPFTMYKLRTMKNGVRTDVHESHVAALIKTNQAMTKLDHRDDRLIRGACFLRMSGLDELPQLINVLRGEMSMIGPRPCLPGEFEYYDKDHQRRFTVLPGLSGLWQCARTPATTYHEMIEMDIRYVDHLSLWTDLKIGLKTPVVMLLQLSNCARSKASKSVHLMSERSAA